MHGDINALEFCPLFTTYYRCWLLNTHHTQLMCLIKSKEKFNALLSFFHATQKTFDYGNNNDNNKFGKSV